MTFPCYPRYKDSAAMWLGDVPAHWELKRLGYYFSERREKVSDVDYPPLSVTKNGVVPQLDTAAKTDDNDNRKRVCKDDFVINSRSDRKGSAGVSDLDGSVSLINTVLRPQHTVDARFVHYLLRSQAFQEEYYRYGKGIVADLWSTNYAEMRNIVLAMPCQAEQRHIAQFLDSETMKVDALITEQQRLIELLVEQRQAIISHAITRGLNPGTPTRPSGVEWLGDVPTHWTVMPLKRLLRSIEQGWSPQCEGFPVDGDEWGVLKVGCVNGGVFDPRENKRLPEELKPIPELGLRAGDLLISRANTRDLVGNAAVVHADHPKLLLCDKLYRLRLDPGVSQPDFLASYLATAAARLPIELAATGASASMVNISQATILELRVPVPPLSEQDQIIRAITHASAKVNALVAEADRATLLLQERCTALISAAVTGKIDVRGFTGAEAIAA